LQRALELLGGDSAQTSVARDRALPASAVRHVLNAGGGDVVLPTLVVLETAKGVDLLPSAVSVVRREIMKSDWSSACS